MLKRGQCSAGQCTGSLFRKNLKLIGEVEVRFFEEAMVKRVGFGILLNANKGDFESNGFLVIQIPI